MCANMIIAFELLKILDFGFSYKLWLQIEKKNIKL